MSDGRRDRGSCPGTRREGPLKFLVSLKNLDCMYCNANVRSVRKCVCCKVTVHWTLTQTLYVTIIWLLAPCSGVFREKLIIAHVIKNVVHLYGTRKFVTVFTRALHCTAALSQMNPVTPSHLVHFRSILMLPSHLRLRVPCGFFPSGFYITMPNTKNQTNSKQWRHVRNDLHPLVLCQYSLIHIPAHIPWFHSLKCGDHWRYQTTLASSFRSGSEWAVHVGSSPISGDLT
jgi:hypothetical protein